MEKTIPQVFAPAAGTLFADCPSSSAMKRWIWRLTMINRSAPPRPWRRAPPDQGQANPLVGLLTCHRALGKKSQVAAYAGAVVQQLQQFDAVPGNSVANG